MNSAPIFTTGTTVTSTGTAVTALIPLDGAGAVPRYIRVTATASGYFRVGKDTTAAVAGDMMVQPGDAVHLAVPGCLWFSFMSVSGSARVTVSPLEYGSWDKRTNQWSLDLDFTRNVLDSRITFTRASSATFTNSAGLVASAATDAPRFDYDPVTRQPKGLLIEEARTNLLTYSEQFDNAAWVKQGTVTVGANVIASPDGTVNSDKIISANADQRQSVYVDQACSATTTYTVSCYFKAAQYSWCYFNMSYVGTSDNYAYFDLTNGVTGYTNGQVSSASITNFGNGWFRCTATFTTVAGQTSIRANFSAAIANNTTNIVGNGTSGLYIWGAQLEAGAFATSYIPTVAAQATRAAENAAMTGTNFSSWYNATEGTLCALSQSVVAFNVPSSVASGAACISDGTVSNRVDLRLQSGGNSFVSFVTTAGVTQATLINSGTYAPNSLYKMAVAYKVNDFARVTNAGTVEIDTSGSVPSAIDQLALGFLNSVNTQLNGTIRSITYWPRRLSNAELQAVTR